MPTGDNSNKSTAELLREATTNLEAFTQQSGQRIESLEANLHALEQHVVDMPRNGAGGLFSGAGLSIGMRALDELKESSSFGELRNWNQASARVQVSASIRAALTNEGAGSSGSTGMPRNPERGGIYAGPMRPLQLIDVLQSRTTQSDSIMYVQLNAPGEAAEQVQEGDEKQNIDFEGTPKIAEVATIAGHTSASKQVISDHQALQQNIDMMLRHKVLSRLEHQLINGPGGQGEIEGFTELGVQFTPEIGETPADKIGESLTAQLTMGYTPSVVLLNPMDWLRIQITKSLQEGEYLFGSPTAPVPPALWNTQIVRSPSVPEGTAITLDTSLITLVEREQVSVMMSNTHKDYFTRNMVAILGEMRAALEVLAAGAVFLIDISTAPVSSGA